MNAKPQVYRPAIVENVQRFYSDILLMPEDGAVALDFLEALVDRLFFGMREDHPVVFSIISNHHPDFLGWDEGELSGKVWSEEDARLIIAREYGYEHWEHAQEESRQNMDSNFEMAVEALVTGDASRLTNMINQKPQLIKQKSSFGHGATLLHYAASNGVEVWRQQVPSNLPRLVELLIDAGADINSTMRAYGGRHTPITLMNSSAHPQAAGVAPELERLLESK